MGRSQSGVTVLRVSGRLPGLRPRRTLFLPDLVEGQAAIAQDRSAVLSREIPPAGSQIVGATRSVFEV